MIVSKDTLPCRACEMPCHVVLVRVRAQDVYVSMHGWRFGTSKAAPPPLCKACFETLFQERALREYFSVTPEVLKSLARKIGKKPDVMLKEYKRKVDRVARNKKRALDKHTIHHENATIESVRNNPWLQAVGPAMLGAMGTMLFLINGYLAKTGTEG